MRELGITNFPGRNNGQSRKYTLESRGADSTMPNLVMASVALTKGMMNWLYHNHDYEVEILPINESKDNSFKFSKDKVNIPSFEYLKQLETLATMQGLNNEEVVGYLKNMLKFAEAGLPEHEVKYLQPFYQMLQERNKDGKLIGNIASQLSRHYGKEITPEQAAEARLYLAQTMKQYL